MMEEFFVMEIVPATEEHVEEFLRQPLRPADVDEWVLASGTSVPKALKAILRDHSAVPRALLNERGQCICLWGVTYLEDGSATLWLIASKEAERRGRQIHRMWHEEFDVLHSYSRTLYAIAYSGNLLHLHWLSRVGFRHVNTWEHPVNLLPFYTFVKTSEDSPCAVH